jgi:hypothetical protein
LFDAEWFWVQCALSLGHVPPAHPLLIQELGPVKMGRYYDEAECMSRACQYFVSISNLLSPAQYNHFELVHSDDNGLHECALGTVIN